MGEHTFTDNELNELRDVFFTEAYEILQLLNQEILDLEAGRGQDDSLRNIQRHLHTLKGNSRAMGFSSLNTLSHKAEDLLKTIQDDSLDVDHALIDLLFTINDALQRSLDCYKAGSDATLDERLMERIEGYLGASESGNAKGARPPAVSPPGARVYDILVTFDPNHDAKSQGPSAVLERLSSAGEVLAVEQAAEQGTGEQPRRMTVTLGSSEDAEAIKNLLAIPGMVERAEIIPRDAAGSDRSRQELKNAPAKGDAAATLRVEAQRVDKILNLVGELVIGRSVVGQVLAEIEARHRKDELAKRLRDANAFMEKTLSQLQKNVMKIRMLPISQVFRKFPRVVRDLAEEKGKVVELVMEGEKTELDKSILDVIGEPLIHLVRNAVDHGIEPPEERERLGKPRSGTITLRASHEGNQIVVDVKDDGRGLDPKRIGNKALEKGVKTQEELDRMSDAEALDLIFLSGFSTTDAVTDISGRGFGMDIVKTTVESLKGRIHVHSTPDEGCTVTLRLPLTLAIIKAMLFRVGERLYALPLSSIEKILRIKDSDAQTIGGKQVLRFRDTVISLVSLRETLTMRENGGAPGREKFVVVVGLAERYFGFMVDALVGQQELVIKALDDHWGSVNCTSGASILGSGKVVLILDAPAIVAGEIRKESGRTQAA